MTGSTSSFGVRLRELRRGAGLTLEQLAEASGVSARAISDMERGHSRAPQPRTLDALADGLRLTEGVRAELSLVAKEARSVNTAGRPRSGEPPRGVADFVGRADELRIARDVAKRAIAGAAPPPVLVVHGQPGLGKTAFAVRVADEVRDDFPDRLYVDLRGTEPAPLPCGEALLRLLRALGVGPRGMAGTDDERSAQLRSVLRDRRCLLILDNAGSESQVRPLLPAEGPNLVIVTGRRALGGLEGVVRLGLLPLHPAESARLLGAIATQANDPAADERVGAVARLCGHLPLALRIAGTRLASRPQWTVGQLADRLADADRRLAALAVGDTEVAAAFDLSYAQLSASAAEMFRRLAHVPGPDFAAPIAAVLAAASPSRSPSVASAEDELEALVEYGLLQPEGAERFRFHDLIRLYATERLRSEESADARVATERRMTDWLLETTIVAGRWYEPGYGALPEGYAGLVPLASLEEAGAWLRSEAGNWVAALRTAAAQERHQLVVDVVDSIHWYSDNSAYWPGWVEIHELSRAAADALPDLDQRAKQLNGLAWALMFNRRVDEAVDVAMEAYRLAGSIGNLEQQAQSLAYVSAVRRHQGRLDEALWAHREALDLADRSGDHDAYVGALCDVAFTLETSGRREEGTAAYEQVLAELDRRPVSPRPALTSRAGALAGIAAALADSGNWPEALAAAERALPVVLELSEPTLEGRARIAAGRAHANLGRPAEARAELTKGIAVLEASMRPGSAMDSYIGEGRTILANLPDAPA